MLVTDPVFVKHLCHFLGNHVAIVLNGDEGNFFSDLGYGLWSGNLRDRVWSFWSLAHRKSIHYEGGEKGGYSNASSDERSGYVL
jgi:hypothetical protein